MRKLHPRPHAFPWRVMVALTFATLAACAEPNGVAAPPLVVTATADRETMAARGLTVLELSARNDGTRAVTLSGCPAAPAYYLDEELGAWFEVASVGVVCPANQVIVRVTVAPGAAVRRSFTVAKPGRYRFRLLVDAPDDGATLTLTSNAVDVR